MGHVAAVAVAVLDVPPLARGHLRKFSHVKIKKEKEEIEFLTCMTLMTCPLLTDSMVESVATNP